MARSCRRPVVLSVACAVCWEDNIQGELEPASSNFALSRPPAGSLDNCAYDQQIAGLLADRSHQTLTDQHIYGGLALLGGKANLIRKRRPDFGVELDP